MRGCFGERVGALVLGMCVLAGPRAVNAAPAPKAEEVAGGDAAGGLWKTDLSLTGNYFSGNLDQAQLLGRVHLRTSGARRGVDVLGSGFRVWARAGDEPYARVGDDLSAAVLPFLYVQPKVYLQGFAGYGESLSRQLDARVNGGVAVGVTPVRSENVLFRASIGAQVEHARYPTDAFNLDVGQEGTTRTVPRAILSSNGWYRVKGTPLSFRYIAWGMLDPRQTQDRRALLDVGADLRVTDGWSTRLTVLGTHDSVVPVGVSSTDVRAGLGLAYATPRGAGGGE